MSNQTKIPKSLRGSGYSGYNREIEECPINGSEKIPVPFTG